MREPGSDLERDLKDALRRKEPPAGFAARVMANLPQERPSRRREWIHAPALRWATVAVVLLAIGGGGLMYREHRQEEERGRIAKQQLMVALRITGAKLQLAQHRVQQIGAGNTPASHETEREQ